MRGLAAIVAMVGMAMGAAGCEDTDVELLQVCGSFCGCLFASPAEQEECNLECEADLAGTVFTPDCLECANRLDDLVCTGLEDCFQTCFPEILE